MRARTGSLTPQILSRTMTNRACQCLSRPALPDIPATGGRDRGGSHLTDRIVPQTSTGASGGSGAAIAGAAARSIIAGTITTFRDMLWIDISGAFQCSSAERRSAQPEVLACPEASLGGTTWTHSLVDRTDLGRVHLVVPAARQDLVYDHGLLRVRVLRVLPREGAVLVARLAPTPPQTCCYSGVSGRVVPCMVTKELVGEDQTQRSRVPFRSTTTLPTNQLGASP